MPLSIGIVGLPNVGKSTLFKAMTKQPAEASNYPFCTIDPNIGMVNVPDQRMAALAEMVNPQRIVPTAIEFVDIAGLVENAHSGEGLGNKFLANIREVDAICQVVRFFEDPDITHVSGSVDPTRDKAVIETELALSDLEIVSKRLEKLRKESKDGDPKKKVAIPLLEAIEQALSAGDAKRVRQLMVEAEDVSIVRELHLISAKPMIYAVNVLEDELLDWDEAAARQRLELDEEDHILPISAAIEAELSELDEAEAKDFLDSMGLEESGLRRLIRVGYETLGLLSFFTAGEKEVRAWTVRQGAKAPEAAGRIHTDFQQKFIRAEVINWQVLTEAGSWAAARDKGQVRTEGKEYVMQDGDVVVFLHGA